MLQACQRQDDAAEASFRLAMLLAPDYALARFNFSYLLLRQGRFAEGWQCLEARNWYARLESLLDCPHWQGETLAGQSILIGIEAGLGDMIQFCRYATLLREKGAARVGLLCHPALTTLFASLVDVDAVIAADGEIPRTGWDCGCRCSACRFTARRGSRRSRLACPISRPIRRRWQRGAQNSRRRRTAE